MCILHVGVGILIVAIVINSVRAKTRRLPRRRRRRRRRRRPRHDSIESLDDLYLYCTGCDNGLYVVLGNRPWSTNDHRRIPGMYDTYDNCELSDILNRRRIYRMFCCYISQMSSVFRVARNCPVFDALVSAISNRIQAQEWTVKIFGRPEINTLSF